jgi:hypothetical protein
MRKSTKSLSQDSQSPGLVLNPEAPEYEADVLILVKSKNEFCAENTLKFLHRLQCTARRTYADDTDGEAGVADLHMCEYNAVYLCLRCDRPQSRICKERLCVYLVTE